MNPEYPCRVMPTRTCPESYGDVCGDRPCARFESESVRPWIGEQCSGPVYSHALEPPERCVNIAGHKGDCEL